MQQRLIFSRLNDEEKIKILEDIDARIGGDINDLSNVYLVENDLVTRRNHLEKSLNLANNEGPIKLGTAIRKAEKSSKEIERLKEKNKNLRVRIEQFMNKTEPLRKGLNYRFSALGKLEQTLLYLKSYEKIDDLSMQLKQSTDDEQAVTVYIELKNMCLQYTQGHRSSYVKENTRYWHNVLRDKFSKQYEEIMKLLKWPLSSNQENSPTPKEIMTKFNNLTRYLLLIKEPDDFIASCVTGDFSQEQAPCLPVRILLRPLKKRFTFHFTGSRQTARIDRPEWFLTQTLTWVKDHQTFMRVNLQPVIDKLQMQQIRAEDEFNAGLIALAAERLHTVLSLYHAQSKGDVIDEDAAFAHAVDETLGFHKELVSLTGKDVNGVLSVLTKAEIFVRWLALEKKYALAKMESCLSSPSWMDGVARAGVAAAVPRGADWLVSLLKTVEERYAVLPQPGHRLQFLELQLELIEEWRVRLTQLLSASLSALTEDTFLKADDSPHTLTAVINAAHHTRGVLMQWAHSLHYLQLHYYRRQFQHFTQQQHDAPPPSEDAEEYTDARERGMEKSMSLDEVEQRATRLALNEASRNNSLTPEDSQQDLTSPLINPALLDSPAPDSLGEESGVFGEAPALLAHLRDAGLTALADHILMEFKAALRDYKRQKWHAMPPAEEMSLSLSPSLCRALGGLYSRLLSVAAKLAPALYTRARPTLARHIDRHVFEEVVLSSWWNAGGTIQFTHDVKRNLLPALAPPQKLASTTNHLPLLMEACQLLNMDYEDARRLHQTLLRQPTVAQQALDSLSILHVSCADAAALLGRRTDLMETTPPSLADLF